MKRAENEESPDLSSNNIYSNDIDDRNINNYYEINDCSSNLKDIIVENNFIKIKEPFALYIHIPFCVEKCPYCDFYSVKYSKERVDQFWAALFQELEHLSCCVESRLLRSIYIGGGTPSLIKPEKISKLLNKIAADYKIPPAAEITLEANPASINEKKMIDYQRAGINRLSLGIQSFDDRFLNLLGRKSSCSRNREVLEAVNRHFRSYSTDIIFALPGQKLADFKNDLEMLLKFDPPHISLYNLEFHENTPFYEQQQRGIMRSISEEVDAEMYEYAEYILTKNSYQQYEISNFAKSGYRAQHNYIYWQYRPYLALGPGASGFDGNIRYQNSRDLESYIAYYNKTEEQDNKSRGDKQPEHNHRNSNTANNSKLKNNKIKDFKKDDDKEDKDSEINNKNNISSSSKTSKDEFKREIIRLSQEEKIAEYCFLRLRTADGLSFHKFKRKFKQNFNDLFRQKVEKLKKNGLIIEANGRIYLSRRGKLLANEVFLEFLA